MKMEMDKFRIKSDEMQFIVLENKPIKASKFTKPENVGKDNWVEVAYITNMEYLMRYVAKRIVLEEDELKDAIARINELSEQAREIDRMLRMEYRP